MTTTRYSTAGVDRSACRRSGGAGVRCRHAAGLRSRLQAGARRTGRRAQGHRPAGCVVGAGGFDRRRFADRPIPVRRLSAAQAGSATRRIAELSRIPATLVLFETGPRIAATLADLAAVLGDREAAVCRELTKMHEEVRRGGWRRWRNKARPVKSAANSCWSSRRRRRSNRASGDDADALLRQALARSSLKDAVGEVAVATGLPRRELYQRALELTKGKSREANDGAPR